MAQNCPGQWICLQGIETPIRISANCKDPECMSEDGINCIIGCPKQIKPLTCGQDHNTIHGMTGYDMPGHWCTKSRLYFNS